MGHKMPAPAGAAGDAAAGAAVATSAAATATGAAAPGQALGLMRLGATLLALPVAMLREVIPCPAALAPLPLPVAGVCGAVQLRGSIIPVLDLRVALGMAAVDAAAEQVIVLMRHAGRLLGLRVDAVQGIAQVPAECLHALHAAGPAGGAVATHSFGVEGGVATLLDAGRIAALPGVPMVAEPPAAADERALGQREPVLLFGCGGLPLGIAAMSVDATVPRTELRASSLAGELCRGVIEHHGHEVPVIDTLRLLGLGQAADPASSAVVVLRFARGLLGLMLDEVRDIVRVAAHEVLPLQPLGLKEAALLRGMIGGGPGSQGEQGGAQHLLLDDRALQAHELLGSLASLSRPMKAAAPGAASGATAAGATTAGAGRPYLTYQVEVETASPLVQASEILVYPAADLIALPGGRDATLGLFMHRGTAVPLVCLCTLLGRPSRLDPASARVLMVEDEGRRIGLVVQALCSIETAVWEQPLAAGAAPKALRALQPLVELGQGTQRRTLPRLDLLQLVRALRTDADAGAVPVGRLEPVQG